MISTSLSGLNGIAGNIGNFIASLIIWFKKIYKDKNPDIANITPAVSSFTFFFFYPFPKTSSTKNALTNKVCKI